MFETLDTLISIGVIFLILSMAHKYIISIFKRAINIRGNIVAREMSTILGNYSSEYLLAYLKKNNKYTHLLDKKNEKISEISCPQFKLIINDMQQFFSNKNNIENIRKSLGLSETVDTPLVKEFNRLKADLALWEENITHTYDNTMKRISDLTESKIRQWTFALGFVFALAMNADFMQIYSTLSQNSDTRTIMVTNSAMVNAKLDLLENDREKKTVSQNDSFMNIKNDLLETTSEMKKELADSGIIFGWHERDLSQLKNPLSLLNKIIGILISALLISFGAPFWHDYLSTFVNIRKNLAQNKQSGNIKSISQPASNSSETGSTG